MTGRFLKNMRIKQKLILINLLTTAVTLLVSGAVLRVNEFYSSRDALTADLQVQAMILASNCTAPLTFNDQKAAIEALNALKASPSIECAAVYDKGGNVFADSGRAGRKEQPPLPAAQDGHTFVGNRVHIFQGIMLDGEKIGSIYIRSDLNRLYSMMVRYGVVAALTMMAVFALALALLLKLQEVITVPLSRLARVMHEVSREKNYAVRADIDCDDETGALAKGFNEMLEQIRKRDTKLQIEVAERRRAEEEVRTLNEQLELKVEERTSQLRDAQEELVRTEKLAMLGLIAGGMGNELRNPLGVMSNAVFFLNEVMPDADQTVKEYLEIIALEIENSERIIADLLDFYHIKTPKKQEVPVHELIRLGLERCVIPPEVAVRYALPESLPNALADPLQMGQVLRNLITNAVQAMPEGGSLTIAARCPAGCGSPDSDPGSFLEISVADCGAGIAPEHLNKLFQPLFTTKSRGIGLGLAFSKSLAEANGGRIEVHSRPGEGTTFTVILPV